MSRSTPSLLALLGLVAVAGYQNRGRISEMLSDAQQKSGAPGTTPTDGDGVFLAEMGKVFHADGSGASISTALSDLVNRFKETGQSVVADSWVSGGPNTAVDAQHLETALGEETLVALSQKTGLSRADLLLRLEKALPEVVNRFTPQGRLPAPDEAESLV